MATLVTQSDIPIHSPDPQDMVLLTNILVYSNTDSATLPFHLSLGTIHPFSEADTIAYHDAMSYTAQYFSDIWFSQIGIHECDAPLTSAPIVAMPIHISMKSLGFKLFLIV